MWWQPNTLALLALASMMALQACGFEPVYGRRRYDAKYERAELLMAVDVKAPPGKLSELFKARLEDHLNPKGRNIKAQYVLDVDIKSNAEPDVIELDGTASRYTIRYVAPFKLRTRDSGKEIDSGTITRLVSYNVSQQDDYSTFIAREAAQKRGMTELAEDFKMRVAAAMHKLIKQHDK